LFRNELLLSNGALPSKVQKTGTTIAAVTFKVCRFILLNKIFASCVVNKGWCSNWC
jgi:hypothetical protein